MAAHQILGDDSEHHEKSQAEQVLGLWCGNGDAKGAEAGHADRTRGGVIGEPLDAQERPVAKELRSQGGHRQVQPLDAQRGYAEEHPHHGGAHPAQQDGDDGRHALHADEEVVGGVGAHRHESAGTQGDLAAVAHQDVQAQCRQRQDQEGDQHCLEQVVWREQGHGDESKGEQQADGHLVLHDREDLLVSAVAGLELAVFAVEHGDGPFTRGRCGR